MIKVCHLTSVHPRNDVRVFYRECQSLTSYYDVSLIVADGLGDQFLHSVQIEDVGKPSNRLIRILIYTWKVFLRGLKSKSHIYHFHDPELFLVGFILRLFGKKVIFDVHENIVAQLKDKTWLPFYLRSLFSQLFKVINFFSIRLFSIVLAETSYLETYQKSSLTNNIITVLNYPDIDSLKNFRSLVRSGNEFFYIGGVSNQRGLDVIVQAAKILHQNKIDFKIHLIGEVSDKYEILDSPGLEKKIIFYGRQDFTYAYSISQNCLAGLAVLKPIDNFIHSYPTKIFEYMSIGLPVITSNFKLYQDIVSKNNTGVCINPLSSEELANTLINFIKLEYDVNYMSKLGVEIVEKKYSWDIELKKLLRLYKNLEN